MGRKPPVKTKRLKEDIALLKIQAALKTCKRSNRLRVLLAARNLALVTGIASVNEKLTQDARP